MRRAVLILLLCQSLLFSKNKNIETSGDLIQILLPVLGYGTTLYLGDREGEREFYHSFFSTVAVTHLLKHTVRRERPNGGDHTSFPSGHTSAAFQGAAFIHKRYGIKYGLPAYLGAAFVGYSRVYADKHYKSDVIAGALIGGAMSYYFTTPYHYKGLLIKPTVYRSKSTGCDLFGINIRW